MSGFDGRVTHRRKLNDRVDGVRDAMRSEAMTVQKTTLTPVELAGRRKQRTADILEAVKQLDVTPSEVARREIIKWLNDVYEQRQGGMLVGLFSRCYLGAPYIDHAISITGEILEHFKSTDSVPPMYVAARPFAASDAYAHIEIYADGQIVPVRHDGSPVL